jgi:hypothetical protein
MRFAIAKAQIYEQQWIPLWIPTDIILSGTFW